MFRFWYRFVFENNSIIARCAADLAYKRIKPQFSDYMDKVFEEICRVIIMIKELMHDPIFLGQKSETATADDLQISQDLLDTLTAHKETCVGMAANMIGAK